MSSKNEPTVNTLISALQPNAQAKQPLKDSNLYQLLSKSTSDLYDAYDALFDGPLPAVSGENLTDLNASAITSGTVPLANLPAGIAFLANANVFSQGQITQADFAGWAIQAATGHSSYGRFNVKTDGDFYISGNLWWNGTAWVNDSGTAASGIRFVSGTLQFLYTGAAQSGIIDVNGVWRIGTPGSVVGAVVGDMVFPNSSFIRGANVGNTTSVKMMGIDVNNLIEIAPDAQNTGDYHLSIPRAINTDLPAAGSTRNGILVLDKTSNLLCYYVGNQRFAVLGSAF